MAIKRNLPFLSLLFIYLPHGHTAECPPQLIEAYKRNTFALVNHVALDDRPLKIKTELSSEDNHIHALSRMTFDRCGALINATLMQEKNDLSAKGVTTTRTDFSIRKEDYGWSSVLKMDSEFAEKATSKLNQLFAINSQDLFMLDDRGVFHKSFGKSEMVIQNKTYPGVATTLFNWDTDGRLSSVKRMSNIASDRSNTELTYDSFGRVIRKESAAEKEMYQYDSLGRELSLTKITTYFTTEKTVTTCQQWNKYGRCILAKQHMTLTIKNDKRGEENVEEHDAVLKSTYTY